MRIFATVISVVFQPLLMPFFAIYLLFSVHAYFSIIYNPVFVNKLYLIALILTVIMPAVSFFILYKWKIITDLKMSNRQERILPTYIALIYYSCFYFLLRKITGLDSLILSALFGGILAVLLANIITSFWKISIHMTAISLVAGIFIGVCEITLVNHLYLILGLFFLIGLVGFSRLYLKKHTPTQVYAGVLVGFLTSYSCIILGCYI